MRHRARGEAPRAVQGAKAQGCHGRESPMAAHHGHHTAENARPLRRVPQAAAQRYVTLFERMESERGGERDSLKGERPVRRKGTGAPRKRASRSLPYMPINNSATIAVEVPICPMPDDFAYFQSRRFTFPWVHASETQLCAAGRL